MYFHLSPQQKELLKDTVRLMKDSDYHRNMSIEKMRTYILGPLIHGKLLVARDDNGEPFSFCTYAFLPPDRESRYMDDPSCLEISDFESEDGTLWCIDFAAPYGGCRFIIRGMREFFEQTYGEGTKARIFRTRKNRYGWMIS